MWEVNRQVLEHWYNGNGNTRHQYVNVFDNKIPRAFFKILMINRFFTLRKTFEK